MGQHGEWAGSGLREERKKREKEKERWGGWAEREKGKRKGFSIFET